MGIRLGLVGIGLVLVGTLVPQVQARESRVALNSWQAASFPVESFHSYTSGYGPRGDGFHYGLDIAAPEGSYIRNWWAGRVVEVANAGNCGTMVVVESGPWEHVYCHLRGRAVTTRQGTVLEDPGSGLQISEGQVVAAGTRIGRVGMTGRTTGPHLHWGLKYAGAWVDPAVVLRAMYSQQQAQLRRQS